MDWETLKSNKWLWLIVGIILFNLVVFGGGEILVRKVTNRVIDRLQKDYSPSPYGPGLDPDKVNPDGLRRGGVRDYLPRQMRVLDLPQEPRVEQKIPEIIKKSDWESGWERDRSN